MPSAAENKRKHEEPDFPRGGASVLTPLEYKAAVDEGKNELFGDEEAQSKAEPESGPKRRKVKLDRGRQEKNYLKQQEKPHGPKLEGLSFARLKSGTLVFGQITSVNTMDLAVALANNLTGYVPLGNISSGFSRSMDAAMQSEEDDIPALEEIFTVGQWVRAMVVESDTADVKRKHIELSLRPEHANGSLDIDDVADGVVLSGSIESVEDKGYIVDLGLTNTRGFITKGDVGDLQKNQVIISSVKSTSAKNRILQLRYGFPKSKKPINKFPTINSLLPGMLGEFLISDIRQNGLVGKVLGSVDATADIFHCGCIDGTEISTKYTEGQKVKARIIASYAQTEDLKLLLSTLPHLVDIADTTASKTPLDSLPISFTVDESAVTNVIPTIGITLDVGIEDALGFVHISRVSDKKIDSLDATTGRYKVGSRHRARVLGYNPLDNLFWMSMEQSVLDQKYIRLDDLKIGEVVFGVVDKVIPQGIVVQVSEGITGFVPELHVADVKLHNPEKRFRPGGKVTCRVLSKDPQRKRMKLTLKKTLVASDRPIIPSISDAVEGQETIGSIVKLLPEGAIVELFGEVRALLPASEMSDAFIKDPSEHFRLGQVVKVHVLSVNKDEGRMRVSCRNNAGSVESREDFGALKLGSIVAGQISEKTNDTLVIEIGSNNVRGSVALGHIADEKRDKCKSMFKKSKVGQQVSAVVLSKNENAHVAVLSMKPSLIEAAKSETLPSSIQDVSIGAEIHGYVKNFTQYGVFIGFAGQLSGLALKANLSENYVTSPENMFDVCQSVRCWPLEIDHQRERLLLTLMPPKIRESKQAGGSLADFPAGTVCEAKILSIKETQLNVRISENVQGRVDISEIFEDWDQIKNKKHPLRDISGRSSIKVRVIGLHDARTHRFLAITHRTSHTQSLLELTAKPSSIEASEIRRLSLDDVREKSDVLGFVNNITLDAVWVNLSPDVRGRVSILDVSDDFEVLHNLDSHFPIGSAVRCRVLKVDKEHSRLDLRIRNRNAVTDIDDLREGLVLPGRITKVLDDGLIVQVNDSVSGRVSLADLSDDYKPEPTKGFSKDDIIRICVVKIDRPNRRIYFSTRSSRTLSSTSPVADPEIGSYEEVQPGSLIRGYVKNVADNGLYISLGRDVVGRVKISHISDRFVKDWKAVFSRGDLVKTRILAVDPEKRQLELSLKQTDINAEGERVVQYKDLKEGRVYSGKIRQVEPYGAFVVLDRSANISGLCHRSEMSDNPIKDATTVYHADERVRVKLLKCDLEKRKLWFGMKPQHLVDEHTDATLSDSENDLEDVVLIDNDADAHQNGADIDVEMQEAVGNGVKTEAIDLPRFDPRADPFANEETQDDENALEQAEQGPRADVSAAAQEFEKRLLGSPNSSEVWIEYMAMYVDANQLVTARKISERALKSIHFREQDEKLNVWVALLNLENAYGDEGSLQKAFTGACQYNDPKHMHLRLAKLYSDTQKHDKAHELFDTTIHKFGQSSKAWTEYAAYLLDRGDQEAARELLIRALRVLPKHKHVKTTTKFARLEFHKGSAERGRTIFEGLLSSHPKRIDLWSILLDMEIKNAEHDTVIRLFQRVLTLKLSMKQAKFFFKKWLAYEEDRGDAKAVELVKQKAIGYVESHQ